MKYACDILIKKPLKEVIELFDNSENLKQWQPTLQSFEHISGEPGQEGAKSKMTYQMGRRTMELEETITKCNFPYEFHATYKNRSAINFMENYFTAVNEGQTKWESINVFKCKGMVRIMAIFMPGAFKKQTKKFMEQFKSFAESQ